MKVYKVFKAVKELEDSNITLHETIIFDNKDHKINIGGDFGWINSTIMETMTNHFKDITKAFKAEQKQIKLVYKIQKKGFNLVQCCDCGAVNLVKSVALKENESDEFDCLECGETNSANDCSDYLYERY